jgi:hypothetical protein
MEEEDPFSGIFPFSPPKKQKGGPSSTNPFSPPFYLMWMRIGVVMDHPKAFLLQPNDSPNLVAFRFREQIRTKYL